VREVADVARIQIEKVERHAAALRDELARAETLLAELHALGWRETAQDAATAPAGLICIKEAAHLSGFDTESIRRWSAEDAADATLPEPDRLATRIGGRWFVRPDKVTAQVVWLCHARRSDFSKLAWSRVKASMMFQRCFLAVETKERMSAKSIAPCNDRKPPEIFCRSFIMRPSRSA
jgi:hypothetical protein